MKAQLLEKITDLCREYSLELQRILGSPPQRTCNPSEQRSEYHYSKAFFQRTCGSSNTTSEALNSSGS